ncbi:hypothetical protein P9112_014553 [Eukaryota sp. TZLM1-RC]
MLSISVPFTLITLLLLAPCIIAKADKPSVLLLYTGGTIGMKKIDGSYQPSAGYLQHLMELNPQFSDPKLPSYTVLEYTPLLDSSNMNQTHWITIAKDIDQHYKAYDGFVVIHGTDTLSYTSSALSFLLNYLRKPVIITGSQVPMCEPYSDGTQNLLGSIIAAGSINIGEVLVFFNNQLMRGNRVQKKDSFTFEAFGSGAFNNIGIFGGELSLFNSDPLPSPLFFRSLSVENSMSTDIYMVMIYPGISADFIRNLVSNGARGIVFLSYGMGNIPDENKELLTAISEANQNEVILIDSSQCFSGIVDLNHYSTGNSMLKAGCISSKDMTPEAAFSKLSYLIGQGWSNEKIKKLIGVNMRGELDGDLIVDYLGYGYLLGSVFVFVFVVFILKRFFSIAIKRFRLRNYNKIND